MNLKYGKNELIYKCYSRLTGEQSQQASIYLWNFNDKVVVSDVDGTITKSDVRGQLLPIFGIDWTHEGVARLYSLIVRNGYKIIYLSSRALSQVTSTKEYLDSISQQSNFYLLFEIDGWGIPQGPLIVNPGSLFNSFSLEVIEKAPQKFKIPTLRAIQSLFPKNPFHAGFGNKTSDTESYQAVSINSSRIHIVSKIGEVQTPLFETATTTYEKMQLVVDFEFPSITK